MTVRSQFYSTLGSTVFGTSWFSDTVTYYTPTQTPGVDTGVSVRAVIVRGQNRPNLGDDMDRSERRGTALIRKTDTGGSAFALTQGSSGDWGTIVETDGTDWAVVSIQNQNTAQYKADIERIEARGVGQVHRK